jgi:hypothetical protein
MMVTTMATEPRVGIFDDVDIIYLSEFLTPAQLRYEIRQSEMKAKITEQFIGTPYEDSEDCFPWQDYAQACRKALETIKNKPSQQQPSRMSHTQIYIPRLKEQTDIVAIVSQYTTLKKSGRNYTALCPFHSEKHPSFYVYPGRQTWHCFGACNTGGDVISFVMRVEGCDFRRACEKLQKGG